MIEMGVLMDRFPTTVGRQIPVRAPDSAGLVYGLLAQRLERATPRHDPMPPIGELLAALQMGGLEQIG